MHPNCENLHFRANFRARARKILQNFAIFARALAHMQAKNFTKILQKFSVYGCTFFCQKKRKFQNNRVHWNFLIKIPKTPKFLGVFGKKWYPTLGSKTPQKPPKSKKYHSDFKHFKNTFLKIFCTSKYGHLGSTFQKHKFLRYSRIRTFLTPQFQTESSKTKVF